MVHGMELEEGSSDVSSTKALMTVVSRYLRDQNDDGHEQQNIRLMAVRACSREAEMTRIRLSRSSDIEVDCGLILSRVGTAGSSSCMST